MRILKLFAPVIIFAVAAIAAAQSLQNFSAGGASLSGGVNNTITKWTGGTTLGNSSLIDDGVTVTGTLPLRAADGTAAAPSYSFTNASDTGFYKSNASTVAVTAGGAVRSIWFSTEQRSRSTEVLDWSSGDPTAAGADT